MGTVHAPKAALNAREAQATRLTFFIAGFCLSAWAPLVPLLKARASLEEGALGLLLLGLGVGSILSMPVAGSMVSRYGCRRVILAGLLLIFAMLPLLAWLSAVRLGAMLVPGVPPNCGSGSLEGIGSGPAAAFSTGQGEARYNGVHAGDVAWTMYPASS